VLADNPVAYYTFGETPFSKTGLDSSGNGNNGTYSGNVQTHIIPSDFKMSLPGTGRI
jgi:hypothetical protein